MNQYREQTVKMGIGIAAILFLIALGWNVDRINIGVLELSPPQASSVVSPNMSDNSIASKQSNPSSSVSTPKESVKVYLNDLDPYSSQGDSGGFINQSKIETVDNTVYDKVLAFRGGSNFGKNEWTNTYDLKSQYASFTTVIHAVSNNRGLAEMGALGQIAFFCDGHEVYSSGTISSHPSEPLLVKIDVSGTNLLKVVAKSYNDNNNSKQYKYYYGMFDPILYK